MDDVLIADREPSAGLEARRYRTALFSDWSGPATYLAPERERLRNLKWNHFTARRLSSTLGAEISGLDLREELSDDVVAELDQALADYKVIFFRNQPITSEQHVAFARRFGELEIHPFIPSNTGVPELVRFEKSAEVAGYENSWHHDVSWREHPSRAAVLHSFQIPDVGGDTLFSDMYAAYDALDDETKALVDGLDAEHDYMQTFGRQVPPERADEMREKYPLVIHPVVISHPATGKKALYVNRNFTSKIVGMDKAESDELLRLLCRQAEAVENQCRFVWEVDSIAMWDNFAVQHYASSDYWPDIRIMERASITGPRPSR